VGTTRSGVHCLSAPTAFLLLLRLLLFQLLPLLLLLPSTAARWPPWRRPPQRSLLLPPLQILFPDLTSVEIFLWGHRKGRGRVALVRLSRDQETCDQASTRQLPTVQVLASIRRTSQRCAAQHSAAHLFPDGHRGFELVNGPVAGLRARSKRLWNGA